MEIRREVAAMQPSGVDPTNREALLLALGQLTLQESQPPKKQKREESPHTKPKQQQTVKKPKQSKVAPEKLIVKDRMFAAVLDVDIGTAMSKKDMQDRVCIPP